VRTGEFLSSTHAMGEIHHPFHFCSFSSNILFTKEAIFPRQEQIILFLESILPCIDTIVEDEFDSSVLEDDSHEFTSILSPEDILWTQIDSLVVLKKEIEDEDEDDEIEDEEYDDDYTCGICGLELSNCYKQCFGCALYARERKPNQKYSIFRICLRCHALSARHFFRSKKIDQYFGPPLSSSEGHTGILPFTRRYQAVRSYFKCDCRQKTRKQCRFCGGCETCACICHALFQTRFRFESPGKINIQFFIIYHIDK
jgi:hypothetical protein